MSNNTLYAFILAFFAGLTTLFGSIIIFINKNSRVVIRALSYAAGVMLWVSITDLIPSSYQLIGFNNIFIRILHIAIYIVIGILLSMFIDKYLPDNTNNQLYKVGYMSMISIVMHNIPEGIITFATTSSNFKLGLTLCIAIALHNIPEGITISVPIYYASNSKLKAILYTLISGMSEVLGSIIAFIFLKNSLFNNNILSILYAVTAGIMFHISIYELLPAASKYGKYKTILYYLLLGIITVIIVNKLL